MEVPIFKEVTIDQFAEEVAGYKERGWRFANLCGSTVGDKVEVMCSFALDQETENLLLFVEQGQKVAAVSTIYPSAFLYENETSDLFGVQFEGTTLDYGGRFYLTSVPTPMNPRSLKAEEFLASDDGEEVNCG